MECDEWRIQALLVFVVAPSNNIANSKVVILSFDDNRKGNFTYAKPILDKYGFKATFFII